MTNKFRFDADSGLLRPVAVGPARTSRHRAARHRLGANLRLALVMMFVFVSSVFGVSVVRAITTSPAPAAGR